MSNIFIGADYHLQHEKAAIHRGFTNSKEHDDLITDNHNSIVKSKRDVVWLLGDICFKTADITILDRLNGIKHLVIGNHEHHNISRYSQYYNKIVSFIVYKETYILTHVPIHPLHLEERFINCINLHGHIHKNTGYTEHLGSKYFNVNIEYHDLKPIVIDDIKKMLNSTFYERSTQNEMP